MKGNAGGVGEYPRKSVCDRASPYVRKEYVRLFSFVFDFLFLSSVSVPLRWLTWSSMRDDDLVTRHEDRTIKAIV